MPKRIRTRFHVAAVGIGALITMVAALCFGPGIAYADSPASGDFGQPPLQEAWATQNTHGKSAAFVTLYPDGRGVVLLRRVKDDTINTFASEYSCWRLDHALTWFVEMPVYVKEVLPPPVVYGQNSV